MSIEELFDDTEWDQALLKRVEMDAKEIYEEYGLKFDLVKSLLLETADIDGINDVNMSVDGAGYDDSVEDVLIPYSPSLRVALEGCDDPQVAFDLINDLSEEGRLLFSSDGGCSYISIAKAKHIGEMFEEYTQLIVDINEKADQAVETGRIEISESLDLDYWTFRNFYESSIIDEFSDGIDKKI